VDEDVVYALAWILGGEGALGGGVVGAEGVERVEVAVIEEGLDGAAGDLAAIGFSFFAGFGFAVGEVDLLMGRVGVEIA